MNIEELINELKEHLESRDALKFKSAFESVPLDEVIAVWHALIETECDASTGAMMLNMSRVANDQAYFNKLHWLNVVVGEYLALMGQ